MDSKGVDSAPGSVSGFYWVFDFDSWGFNFLV